MEINSARLIYFSPTGGTKGIIDAIVNGMGLEVVNRINLTYPANRVSPLAPVEEDLLIIGAPVYFEKIPAMLVPLLKSLDGAGKPAVVVSVYGNVGFGVSLKQLESTCAGGGFSVVAAGAFIGEHSFSSDELPVARGRPDDVDIGIAVSFGKSIARKLAALHSIDELEPVVIPGKMPWIARFIPDSFAKTSTKVPIVDSRLCNNCGACVISCPTGSINKDDLFINNKTCIRCFSCVKICHASARMVEYKTPRLLKAFFKKNAGRRREPRLFM
ncbi:MAG: 4Fe-4S dicluster domain-containing protein [Promethearchaeota archaeon]